MNGTVMIAVRSLAENWWAVALRGVVSILFGVLTLALPALTLAALVALFGAYALVDGVLAIVSAIRRRGETKQWWGLVFHGVAGIATGVVTLLWPGITALALLYVVAAWAIITGILEIVTAIRLRKAIEGEWLLALSGIASLGLGVLLALFPGPGALALVIWIGALALVSGALFLALGLRLRRLAPSSATHARALHTSEPRHV